MCCLIKLIVMGFVFLMWVVVAAVVLSGLALAWLVSATWRAVATR
jgi:hypothetical protein